MFLKIKFVSSVTILSQKEKKKIKRIFVDNSPVKQFFSCIEKIFLKNKNILTKKFFVPLITKKYIQ